MIEDDLRAAFARHEPLTPATGPLRAAIDRLAAVRRRRRRRTALGGATLALLAVTGLGSAQVITSAQAPGQAELLAGPTGGGPAGAMNLLLLGVDSSGPQPPMADSILLVHVPADRSRLYLLSIPRDLKVAVPGHGSDKINAAFAFGSRGAGRQPDLGAGYRLTSQVVARLTGVRVDAGAVLTYPVLRKVTDAVGGVELCLPTEVRSIHTGRTYPVGCQHLDGAASVDLLRQRRTLAGDSQDRDRNAQRFAAALVRRADERGVLHDPVRVSRLAADIGPHLTLSSAGGSLLDLLALVPRLKSAEVVGLNLPAVPVDAPSHRYEPDPAAAPELLAALREDRLAAWVAAHPERVTGLR
ncbi:LCP family protein [Micromonospora sp. NPDC002296]|uniref:LCP family protein n=1 Tax=Micromonospora sp. NPDC002296 TaxID=3154271 RepID=UPI00332599C7